MPDTENVLSPTYSKLSPNGDGGQGGGFDEISALHDIVVLMNEN